MRAPENIIAQEVAEIIALASQNYAAEHPSVEPKDEVCIFTLRLLICRPMCYAVITPVSTSPVPL